MKENMIAALVAGAMIAGAAGAQTNLVTNGGFESPGLQGGEDFRYLVGESSTFLTGWTCVYDGVQEPSYVYRQDRYETTEGSYTVYFNDGDTLSTVVTLKAGVEYRFSFDEHGATPPLFEPFEVHCGSVSFTMTNDLAVPTGGTGSRGTPVYRCERTFVAPASGALTLTLVNPQNHTECYACGGVQLDTIRLVAACCAADFNCDGFVSGGDFDEYVQAFEAGDLAADFDGDGFNTGVDFDLFVQAFEAGC